MKAQIEQLYGTWRLVSRTEEGGETDASSEIAGNAPQGFITYGQNGRMSVITIGGNRPKPKDLTKLTDQERVELFNTTIAYAGTFTVEGNRVTHNVDISWNETLTGTSLVRHFQIEGNTLTIRVDPMISPTGERQPGVVLMWEKVQ
ncbi:MAG: lipocalin-like domain-containing protein [Desulfobacterales bacterium]|nr:lipocalin-like domain-containing protein [Desulfobacterales bacterium]